jgi:intergrase/recombinase
VNNQKAEKVYNFCIDNDTGIMENTIEFHNFLECIIECNFTKIQKSAIKKNKKTKCAYIIYILSYLIEDNLQKDWYKKAAKSVGLTPQGCSRVALPSEWKRKAFALK